MRLLFGMVRFALAALLGLWLGAILAVFVVVAIALKLAAGR